MSTASCLPNGFRHCRLRQRDQENTRITFRRLVIVPHFFSQEIYKCPIFAGLVSLRGHNIRAFNILHVNNYGLY